MRSPGSCTQTYHCSRVGLADAYNNLADLNIVYSIKELQAWPNTFDERFKFVGPFLDDRSEAAAFPFEELGDRPVIYISLGTVFNAKDDFYRRVSRHSPIRLSRRALDWRARRIDRPWADSRELHRQAICAAA